MPKQVDYIGMKFTHNVYGEYEVIKDLGLTFTLPNGRNVRRLVVKFKNTGYTVETFPDCVMKGQIKDPYFPVIAGVGYMGEPVDFEYKKQLREYNTWLNMINKCYNKDYQTYRNNGGSGITVCKEWHCFANFLNDLRQYPEYNVWRFDKSYGIGLCGRDLKEYNFDNCILIENGGSNAMKTTQFKKKYKKMYHLVDPNNTPNYVGKKLIHPVYGEYTIIHEAAGADKNPKVVIKFTNTGYEKTVFRNKALNGKVRDPYCITKCGVGYLGETEFVDYDKECGYRIQAIWADMIGRCYNPNNENYQYYGAKGVRVCERWHCYANFLQDFINMDNYDNWKMSTDRSYHLDKDYLQQHLPINQRVYSPDTCMLVPITFNTALTSTTKSVSSDYIGVSRPNYITGNVYKVNLNYNNDNLIYNAKFDNEYYAAVYRDYYAKAYGISTVYNNVPITDDAFREAQAHRIQDNQGTKFKYKQMYHVVDPTKDKG